jgi:hypothetical protein
MLLIGKGMAKICYRAVRYSSAGLREAGTEAIAALGAGWVAGGNAWSRKELGRKFWAG